MTTGRLTLAKKQELAATARHLIDHEQYLILATADRDGRPWASPLWYAHAGHREFLWVSSPDARHSRNIEVRPQVSMVIFDSSAPPSGAQAVYISGAAEVTAGSGLDRSVEIYSRRSQKLGLPEWTPAMCRAPARVRLYRAIAREQFVLMPDVADVRIPVALSGGASGGMAGTDIESYTAQA
jgi:nitroimidazol reductase NimA-like FMN-containing flavoprotein (pyridoxamine 5'-phosphate oxidase superfamily)